MQNPMLLKVLPPSMPAFSNNSPSNIPTRKCMHIFIWVTVWKNKLYFIIIITKKKSLIRVFVLTLVCLEDRKCHVVVTNRFIIFKEFKNDLSSQPINRHLFYLLRFFQRKTILNICQNAKKIIVRLYRNIRCDIYYFFVSNWICN